MYIYCFQGVPVLSVVGSFETVALAAIGLKAIPILNQGSKLEAASLVPLGPKGRKARRQTYDYI